VVAVVLACLALTAQAAMVFARLYVPAMVVGRLYVPALVVGRLYVPGMTGMILSPLTMQTILGTVIPGLLVATMVIYGPRGRRATGWRVVCVGHQRNRDAGTAEYGGRGEGYKCLPTAASHGHSSDRGNGTFVR
jgi:hypothetical protein